MNDSQNRIMRRDELLFYENMHGPFDIYQECPIESYSNHQEAAPAKLINDALITAPAAAPVSTYFIYSFDGLLLAEYNNNGSCMKEYIYSAGQLIAEYLPQERNYYFYTSDQINSTRVILDSNGTKVYSAVYDAYGGVLNTSPFEYDPVLKFSGKERDHESELDNFGARYYNHSHSQFISTDPIINKEEALYNPQLWNLYSYCRNNPVTYLDPDGRTDIKINVVREFARVNSILGRLSVEGTNISGYTLELPWRNNQTDISAIPLGEYQAILDESPSKNYLILRLMNVESRENVLMHGGNIPRDTKGCLLVGRNRDVRNEMISDRNVLQETTNLIQAINYIDRTILHEPTNITVNVSVNYSEAVNSLRNFSRSLYRNIFNY